MSAHNANVRQWLVQNGYSDIATKINKLMARWERIGKRTRRNWWDVLAGTKQGKPIKVESCLFPILRAARDRKGWEPTPNCLCRNNDEIALPIVPQSRWSNRARSALRS